MVEADNSIWEVKSRLVRSNALSLPGMLSCSSAFLVNDRNGELSRYLACFRWIIDLYLFMVSK